MLDVMQSSDGTMKERSGNNTCICIGFGIKFYASWRRSWRRLRGVLEVAWGFLEAFFLVCGATSGHRRFLINVQHALSINFE